jgi:cobalt/nickel transport system permease protein
VMPLRAFGSTIRSLTRALSHALVSEETARQPGVMQSLDPRVRVVGTLALVLSVALAHQISVVAGLFGLAVVLAVTSHIPLSTLAIRVWLVVLAFTGVIALPALLLTPGVPLTNTPFAITQQGLHAAIMLLMRVEAAVTFTTVLVLSTAWPQILKALRALHVPREAVMMLGMAHRYLFLLAETATQMFESRESRRVGTLTGPVGRKVLAQTAGVLMSKSMDLSQEVFLAMQSRGYTGEVHLATDHAMSARDYAALFAFLIVAVFSAWVGR